MVARIVVLGGGVSGLSAAFYLARGLTMNKVAHKITLLEKGSLGGWIQTKNTGDGVFELGPRSVRTAGFVGLHSLRLVYDLGLEEKVVNVTTSSISNQNRFIYANNQLNLLPNQYKLLLKTQPPLSSSILSILLKTPFKRAPVGSETMHEVISGKLGEELTKYYVDAFARGVFAADIKELSLKAAFPDLWKQFRPRKSTLSRRPELPEMLMKLNELSGNDFLEKSQAQKWTQWNLEGGLCQFIDGLERACGEYDVDIVKNATTTAIALHENGKFSVTADFQGTDDQNLPEDSLENVDHVISALPAHDLSKILLNESSEAESANEELLKGIGSMLQKIKFVDVGVVNLEFKGSPEKVLPRLGFGHLVPSCEKSKVLGIVYDSCVLPQHDRKDFPSTRLTCMMGGSWFNEVFGDPEHVKDCDLEDAALESVAEQLGITSDPATLVSKLCRNCIPTYRVGHTDLVEKMEDVIKENEIPLSLGGASYWGVSVNDCIFHSRVIASDLLRKFQPK